MPPNTGGIVWLIAGVLFCIALIIFIVSSVNL